MGTILPPSRGFRSFRRRGVRARTDGPGQGPERRLSLSLEIALVSAAWLVYFGVRALTEGDRSAAISHAQRLLEFEERNGLAWEDEAQEVVQDHRFLLDFANWVYIWGHWPVIVVTAVWLFTRHQQSYRFLRDAMFISGAIGLAIFALVPVAPPRLAGMGLLDTVTTYSTSYRALQPPAFTNIYAAMPSLHFGWDLLVGIAIFLQARRWPLRVFGAVMPVLMAMAVVATANHFVVDVIAGGALALFGLVVAMRLAPLNPERAPGAPRLRSVRRAMRAGAQAQPPEGSDRP